MVEELDPTNYGWICENDILIPKFATKASIPQEVRKIISLFCNEKNCNNNKCACKNEGIPCSIECKCNMNCNNNSNYLEEEENYVPE